MPRLASSRAPRTHSAKRALFAVYVTTLSLTTTPHARTGGGLTALHGLRHGPGRAPLGPRSLVWAVAPLWGVWSVWFDTLVATFAGGGRLHVAGAGHLALAGRGLEWATGEPGLPRFRPTDGLTTDPRPGRAMAPAHFWLVLHAQRGLGELSPPPNAPVFTVGGLHYGVHRGWCALPGPLGCPRLGAFVLGATLAAYKEALGRRPAP